MSELTSELLRQQDELQAEAEAVEVDLELGEPLKAVGEPFESAAPHSV